MIGFFFQAEDGIRDIGVTGVQTCALPILGQRETSFGTQLWWNWELDEDHYRGWDQLREQLEGDDVRLMTYIGPWLADDVTKKENLRRNLFEEAARNGYLVKNRDGEPYRVKTTDFSAAFVDLTNPE